MTVVFAAPARLEVLGKGASVIVGAGLISDLNAPRLEIRDTTDRCSGSGVTSHLYPKMNMSMSTTFLRRALLSQNHFSRTSCILPRHCAHIRTLASVGLPETARSVCRRPVSARAFQVSQSRPVSQLSVATSPSVLQFVSSTVWKATHRSQGASSRTRWPSQPPRPPSLWERIRGAVNAIPHNVIFWGILAVNGIVYVTWNYAHGIYVRDLLYRFLHMQKGVHFIHRQAQVTPACTSG